MGGPSEERRQITLVTFGHNHGLGHSLGVGEGLYTRQREAGAGGWGRGVRGAGTRAGVEA